MRTDTAPRTLGSVCFRAAIQNAAATLGRAPTESQVTIVDEMLKTFAVGDPETGQVTVEIEPGQPVPLTDFLTAQAGKFAARPKAAPTPVDPAKMVKLELGASTSYRRADDGFARVVGALKAADDAATAREVAAWRNPWLAGQINRTHQAVITRTQPTLAAQMKRAAGITS